MTRPRPLLYAGAAGAALPPDAIGSLVGGGRAVGLMLKADGLYCQLTTGRDGRIDSVVSQLGRTIPGADDLIGIHAAPPYSTMAGEYSGHTEAGSAESEARGYAVVHLFDCLRLAGQPLAQLPYQERHGALYRAQSWIEGEGMARARTWGVDAQGDAHGASGRYVAAIPRDLRRLPVLPIVRGLSDALALWDRIDREGLEGAVAVDLTAPIGRRGAKRKIKVADTIDCVVVASDATCSQLRGLRAGRPVDFAVGGVAEVGTVVEVRHHGWYGSGLPRFPSIARARVDKRATDRGALIEWRA